MAKLTIGQKAERVLKLLMGLRNPRVAEALRQYGFQDKDLEEGWQRLKALTDNRLSVRAPTKQDPSLLAQLDAWENRWFPVAQASLRGRFPEAHAYLFLNLTQTAGAEVILSVSTFLQRLNRLASEPALKAEGAAARELLLTRGLNAAAIQAASALLEQLGTLAPAAPAVVPDPAQQAEAEASMWSWYLEWGEIARVAVSERRLLKELGFLNAKRPVIEEESAPQEEPEEESSELLSAQ